jgi:tRNA (guanine-N7-)-methyltransferase
MGRRSLPKIKSTLDIRPYFHHLADLPSPLPLEDLFEQPGELEVEVGTGKGLFLCQASELWPERRFLGIEIAPRYARYAASRLAARQRANARILQGDGQRLFREFLEPASVRAVHVYFPDPWWKRRHRKRRVLSGPFLQNVERLLRPGGKLYFRTDVEEYFRVTLRAIAQLTSLDGPLAEDEWPSEESETYRTHFERRMRLSDLPVYSAEFRRSEPRREEGVSAAWKEPTYQIGPDSTS